MTIYGDGAEYTCVSIEGSGGAGGFTIYRDLHRLWKGSLLTHRECYEKVKSLPISDKLGKSDLGGSNGQGLQRLN